MIVVLIFSKRRFHFSLSLGNCFCRTRPPEKCSRFAAETEVVQAVNSFGAARKINTDFQRDSIDGDLGRIGQRTPGEKETELEPSFFEKLGRTAGNIRRFTQSEAKIRVFQQTEHKKEKTYEPEKIPSADP